MTHQNDFNLSGNLAEVLLANGLDGLPEIKRIIVNTSMQAGREKHLQAGEYKHTDL
jgi:hypothetical protein